MKTLFFQAPIPFPGDDFPGPNRDPFEPGPAAPIDDWSYWIFGIIVLICVTYMAYTVYKAYKITYSNPRKQSKWLKERYPEESN